MAEVTKSDIFFSLKTLILHLKRRCHEDVKCAIVFKSNDRKSHNFLVTLQYNDCDSNPRLGFGVGLIHAQVHSFSI